MKQTIYLLAPLCFLAGTAHALNVSLPAKAEGGNKPVIVGSTNLPDGITLKINISGKESGYEGEQKVVVKDGTFQSAAFPLRPGRYAMEVFMTPFDQSESTIPVIGKGGSKLEGPLTQKFSLDDRATNVVAFTAPVRASS